MGNKFWAESYKTRQNQIGPESGKWWLTERDKKKRILSQKEIVSTENRRDPRTEFGITLPCKGWLGGNKRQENIDKKKSVMGGKVNDN